MYLYNSLSHKKELFTPIDPKLVKMYTCGPTVYHFAHIGNLRSYIMEDVLEKFLRYDGYDVTRVMNITDVGHLASDADTGEEAVIWTPYPFADVPQVLRLRQKVLPFLRGIEWRAEGQVRTIAEHEGLMGCH